MEKAARSTLAKLPKLKITQFNGTKADWVRFENMFITQVDSNPTSDEEKFGYLLEMVSGKVRDKIQTSNRARLDIKQLGNDSKRNKVKQDWL
jgi:hypothetical protein